MSPFGERRPAWEGRCVRSARWIRAGRCRAARARGRTAARRSRRGRAGATAAAGPPRRCRLALPDLSPVCFLGTGDVALGDRLVEQVAFLVGGTVLSGVEPPARRCASTSMRSPSGGRSTRARAATRATTGRRWRVRICGTPPGKRVAASTTSASLGRAEVRGHTGHRPGSATLSRGRERPTSGSPGSRWCPSRSG